jgi:predicted DNA binding CopG/RHH family protein
MEHRSKDAMKDKETRTTIVVPTSLWRQFKIAVIQEGMSLQAKIRALIEEYLANKAS